MTPGSAVSFASVTRNVTDCATRPGVCMCVSGGGGNQDVITVQTSTMTPLSATVSRKCVGVGGCGGAVVTNAFTLTTRVGTCVRLITMEMSTYVK